MNLAIGLFFGSAAAALTWRRIIMNSSDDGGRGRGRRRSFSKPCSHGHEKLMKHTEEFGKKVRIFSFKQRI